ncbi:hypothetical protein DKAM_0785 [Desulfurococcus amylolyticus 1221n]|uniref:Uncharacterized protein n=1 Tax=Desulfurococcus amylolyticus (strain DSM 18924 / JCM 16383 / VKM B-2413 / 1221n) TaxID=490899 RepID=B8D4T0_DESA1|nr:hypothetical protein DKAM_0785 [Desulfurococcus amylolyticus 1221n]
MKVNTRIRIPVRYVVENTIERIERRLHRLTHSTLSTAK